MSLELLQGIEKVEAKAEEIRAQAQKESREILKSVEEACVTEERNAALEHRALMQRIVEEARAETEKRIQAAAVGSGQARDEVVASARQKLDDAANLIFERVVSDGHR